MNLLYKKTVNKMFNLFKKKPIKKVEEMEITKDNISIFLINFINQEFHY